MRHTGIYLLILLAVLAVDSAGAAEAQTAATAVNPDKPFVAEYYYKAKWGYADEFITLFKKNHYPLLKKEIEMGRILKVYRDPTSLSCHRRWPLGLSRDHRL